MCMLLFIRPLPFHMIQFLRICTIYIFTHLKISIFWTQQMWVSFRFWPNHWGQDSLVWKISCRRKISCLRRKCWIKNAPHQPLPIFMNLPWKNVYQPYKNIFCKASRKNVCKQGSQMKIIPGAIIIFQSDGATIPDKDEECRSQSSVRTILELNENDPRRGQGQSQKSTRTIPEDNELIPGERGQEAAIPDKDEERQSQMMTRRRRSEIAPFISSLRSSPAD